jgi:hypothetical protein
MRQAGLCELVSHSSGQIWDPQAASKARSLAPRVCGGQQREGREITTVRRPADRAWPEPSQPGCSACPFWTALDRHDGDTERTVFTPVLQSLILRAWTFQVTQGS